MNSKLSRGFTMIELMVVIVIIGILAAMVVPRVMSRPEQARIIACKQDISSIKQALILYKLDNGSYPTLEQGLSALVTKPDIPPIPENWSTKYLDRLPRDPWGSSYLYNNPSEHDDDIDIYSSGGSKVIGSWEN